MNITIFHIQHENLMKYAKVYKMDRPMQALPLKSKKQSLPDLKVIDLH